MISPTVREMRLQCDLRRVNDFIAEGCEEVKPENGMMLYSFCFPINDAPPMDELRQQFAPLSKTKRFSRLQKPAPNVIGDVICEFPLLIFKAFDAVYFKDCFIVRFYCFDVGHNPFVK